VRHGGIRAVVLMASIFSFACAGKRPADLGPRDGRLRPCPASPNCVCSDDTREGARVPPLDTGGDPARAWTRLQDLLRSQAQATIVTAGADYLHVEFRSRLFGFTDDVEFHLRPAEGIIAVRSASRLGYSDLGVNRSRIEAIRRLLLDTPGG
jgi:uncharacterized protein (DUF1499 family)